MKPSGLGQYILTLEAERDVLRREVAHLRMRPAAEPRSDVDQLRRQLRVERDRVTALTRRCELLERQTRAAFSLGTWGGARRPASPTTTE